MSVTPTRNLGYFLPQGSSSKSVFYSPALDALESPCTGSCDVLELEITSTRLKHRD